MFFERHWFLNSAVTRLLLAVFDMSADQHSLSSWTPLHVHESAEGWGMGQKQKGKLSHLEIEPPRPPQER